MSSTQTFAGLLPILLRRELAARERGADALATRRFPAAVLIADVSGFTSLAERLAARGPEGVEELSRLVNRWFGAMVDAIDAHGGDVIRFAGDAPIAVFPADIGALGLAAAVDRARACGAALREIMRAHRSSHADVSVRVGVGAGTVTSVIAGGVDGRWEFVVGGSPLDQMTRALHRAAPDEIVVSAEADAARAAAGPAPAPLAPLDAAAVDDARLRPFVPGAVLPYLDAGHSAWTAELRRVTTLFVSIDGVDLDAAGGPELLHDVLRRAQTAVFAEGGSVNQFLIDDKGLTLVAAWGVSGHRHEDDAVRAIRAAQTCRAALEGVGAVGAGLATGRVFCGWRGNPRRREYALIGAVVNRAARLMIAAGDGVLCDAETARAGAAAGPIEDAGAIALKGSAQPVQTFRPIGAAGTIAPATPAPAATSIVGRQAERDALAAALASLEAGASASIVIRGEPGMGKSTLVSHLIATAHARPIVVALGQVESASSAAPYGPWRSVLGTVLGLDGVAGVEARRSALRAAIAATPETLEYAALVEEVLGLPIAAGDPTSRIVQQERVDKTRDVIVALLQHAAASRPLVVILDNVQWMDSLSIALARAAARRVSPLLLVLATRPIGADASADAVELIDAATQVLDLSRLSPGDVRRLICQRLRVTHVPDDLTAVIEEKAAGYPLFVGELVSALLDAGVIQTSGSACVLVDHGARLRTYPFPDSVQGAIADRLDRIGAAALLTMKVASAAGARFDLETIAAVHPLQTARADLDTVFASLVDRGLIVRHGADFEFGHAIVQDVTYGLMPGDQRRALHRAIAVWYERARDLPPAVMAHHWTAAGDDARSLDWLERGGEDASRLGAFRETLRHLDQAFAIAAGPSAPVIEPMRRVRWLRLRGLAHSELGAMDEATGQLRAALELLGARLPASPAAMGARLGREAIRQTALLAGIRRAPARLPAAARGRTIEAAEALRLIGKLAYYSQDHLRYITASLESINLSERAGARATAGSAYAALGYIVAMLGLERLARRWWRLADESGVLDAQLNRLIGQMLFFNSHVRWAESLRCADEQAALIARAGTSMSMPSHLMIRGYIDLHHGRFAQAEAEITQLLDWCLSVNHLQQAFAARLQLCAVMIEQGRADEARRHLGEADALSSRVADPLFLSIYHGHHVRVRLLVGDVEAADAPAASLRALMKTTTPYFGEMVGYVAMTEYLLARARRATPAEARAFTRDARWAHAALRRHASLNPYARPRAWLLEGQLSAAEGRAGRAHRAWRRALALAERFDMPREIAYAHADLGAASTLPPADRLAHLHEARARFAAIGSPHRVAAIDRLLGDQAPGTPSAGTV